MIQEALWDELEREKAVSKQFFSLEKRVEFELKALLARQLWQNRFAKEKRGAKKEIHLLEQLVDLHWNHSSPLLRVLFALDHHLLQLPTLELGFSTLPCGAIPLSLGEYQPFSWIPYQPEHVQLGVFLLLLGVLKRERNTLEMGMRLGHWQQKLLCFHSTPAWGVFARLGTDTRLERLALYKLLKQGMRACHVDCKDTFCDVSVERGALSPLWVLIEQTFHHAPSLGDFAFCPDKIENWDPSCGLLNVKTESETNYFTLHGGKTGLGAMHKKRIELVTYGPSYAPFAKTDGFGIEANGYSQEGLKKLFFQRDHTKISIKSCVRMVDQPSRDPGGMACFRGIWLEVRQEWQNQALHLDTRVLSLDSWADVGMRFLVRADSVEKETKNHVCHALHFQSGEEGLRLESLQKEGSWQLQPIEQPDFYWGANWQAVFLFTNERAHYSWKIACSGG